MQVDRFNRITLDIAMIVKIHLKVLKFLLIILRL